MARSIPPEAAEDDPIDRFLREQAYHGRSDRTIVAYERVLRDFGNHVKTRERNSTSLSEVDRETCMSWVHGLRGEVQSSTVATYATYINRFYRYMVDVGEFDQNPMGIVVEQMSEHVETNPVRRDISLADMRSFIADIRHPLDRAIVLTLLKTGVRVGELCNLDLRDMSLPDVPTLDSHSPRPALDGRAHALFIDNDPERGVTVNGEERTSSNKRRRATIIPIDEELRLTLLEWLAIRPDAVSPAEPLFLDTRDAWGQRLNPESVRYRVRTHAERAGWYESGAGAAENVTPHYFRHFFTTYLRDRIGDRGIVKYLRGDVADDVIDTYTHNWGDRVRRRYEDHIYSVL